MQTIMWVACFQNYCRLQTFAASWIHLSARPAHTAFLMQDWLNLNCTGFIERDKWPPNSPDLNPLGYHVWGATLEKYHNLQPNPKTTREKIALEQIYRKIYPRNPSIKQSKTLQGDSEHVLILVEDILNTSCEAVSKLFN